MTPTVDVLTGIGMAFIIVVGAGRGGGTLPVGVLVTFILSAALLRAGEAAVDAVYGDAAGQAAGHRIFEVLDAP